MQLLDRLAALASRHSYRLSGYLSYTLPLECGARELHLPVVGGMGLHLRNFADLCVQRILRQLYDEGRRGCLVDIGANTGAILLNLLALDLELSYLGFEPDVGAAHYVQRLIRANGLKRHHVLPLGLGRASGTAEFHTAGEGSVNNTLGLDLRPAQMYTATERVAVSTADTCLAGLAEELFLVKIDTEGWELPVLEGMLGTLEARRPPVYFEVMGYRHFVEGSYPRAYFGGELSAAELQRLIDGRRANMEDLRRFWSERGYKLFHCEKDGSLEAVDTLDPGPHAEANRGEMNFLARG